jgi:undecaprenyldiphospho-muramoylpentapeptide beta-N-acetylglucosaminyltransferase
VSPGIVIAGGGTAGHVSPALAIAEALVEGGRPRESVRFVGSARGMEARLVPDAGFSITLLPGRGLKRKLTPENGLAIAELAVATARALALLRRNRPEVVVTVAGYASVPCALAARLLMVPIVVVNIDAVPGAANRLVGRFAELAAVALPGTPLPRAVVTGAPVRASVLAVDRSAEGRAAARARLGVGADRFVILVTSGSLGARTVNEAVLGCAVALADRRDLVIYHVSGTRDHASVAERLTPIAPDPARGLDYRLVAYETAMPTVLAACDLVIGRAGASTVAELTVIGLPSVLIPLPGAPGDHQTKNAELLEKAGAAIVIADPQCTTARLASVIDELAGDRLHLADMAAAARALGNRDGASRVAKLVEEIASRRTAPAARGGETGRAA